MNKLMSLVACASVATLAACATQPEPASRSQILETTAVVESIDLENRHVLLKTEDGRMLTIVAGPEVINLDQVEPGDGSRRHIMKASRLRWPPTMPLAPMRLRRLGARPREQSPERLSALRFVKL